MYSGRGAVRLAHLTGGQGVVGSNPIAPTMLKQKKGSNRYSFFIE